MATTIVRTSSNILPGEERDAVLLQHRGGGGVKILDLLVVPQAKVDTIMHLAHTHLLRGHLGTHNTL